MKKNQKKVIIDSAVVFGDLKNNNLGRVTFYPISVIKPKGIDYETNEILENIHELTNIDKNVEISLTEKQEIFNKLQKYLKLMEINIKN